MNTINTPKRTVWPVWLALLVLTTLLAGCAPTIPNDAMTLTEDSLQERQMQTRTFETSDEATLLSASAAVLQDLGYLIEDSETKCGLIVTSRDRDVTDAGEVLAAVLLGALSGVPVPWDEHQRVIASLVTRPIGDEKIAVRITFQHMVWNSSKQLVRNETINDPEIYQEFFSKLSKSVFLTAHDL